MYHAFKQCKQLGAIAQVHAENGDLIVEVCSNILVAPLTVMLHREQRGCWSWELLGLKVMRCAVLKR